MAWGQKKTISLRGLLLLILFPVTGLPLILFGALSFVWIEKALESDLKSRMGPEIASFQSLFETIEKRLNLSLQALSSKDLNESLIQNEKNVFDQLVFYKKSGDFFKELNGNIEKENSFDLSPRSEIWKRIIPRGKPQAGDTARSPSSQWDADLKEFVSPKERFIEAKGEIKGKRLKENFRKFLSRTPSFILSTLKDGSLEYVVGRSVKNPDGQIQGFVMGRVVLDSNVLQLISTSLGRDFAIFNPRLKIWASPQNENLWAFRATQPKSFPLEGPRTVTLTGSQLGNNQKHFVWFPWQGSSPEESLSIGIEVGQGGFTELGNWLKSGLIYLGLSLFVASTLLALFISRGLSRPLTQLLNATEKMRSGFVPEPVSSQGWVREFDQLVEQFNEMAHTVEVGKKSLREKIEQLGQTNKELHETQDQLVHSAKMSSMGQLVAGVAHELNNPIAFIYSNMTQLKEYSEIVKKMDEEIKKIQKLISEQDSKNFQTAKEKLEWDYVVNDIQEIAKSCLEGSVRVKDIVLGLKTFSRSGGYTFESVHVKNLVDTTLKLMGKSPNKVKIIQNIEENLFVYGNASQLGQVILNLVNNAVQACGPQGGVVEIQASSVKISGENPGVRLRISDTGAGIPPENLPKIFDPFFSTKKVGEGTGLGLSIVYGIVQKHNGKIRVESQLASQSKPGGTTFTVDIPAAQSSRIAS